MPPRYRFSVFGFRFCQFPALPASLPVVGTVGVVGIDGVVAIPSD